MAKALRYLDGKVSHAIDRYGLIGASDHLLVAVSGGKDSFVLLEVLAARRGWTRDRYELTACHVVDPFCTTSAQREAIEIRCRQLDVPLELVERQASAPIEAPERSSHLSPTSAPCQTSSKREYPTWTQNVGLFNGTFPTEAPISTQTATATTIEPEAQPGRCCFHCAWDRRRLLFQAAERCGCRSVALGHHLDDLVETFLLNLLFHGEQSTMAPRQEFFEGRLAVIRPLILVEERVLRRVARMTSCPSTAPSCPAAFEGQRAKIKALLAEFSGRHRYVKKNLARVALATLAVKEGL